VGKGRGGKGRKWEQEGRRRKVRGRGEDDATWGRVAY